MGCSMKNKWIILIGSFTLVLPLLVVLAVFFIKRIYIFDNPDFWYGYMAYFGTIVLAVVALWQNEIANQTNKRIMNQQLRQKIGYFNLAEVTGEKRNFNKYQDIYVRENPINNSNNTEEYLVIGLKNVGEDIILNPKVVSATINERDSKLLTTITAIYTNETIAFEFKNPKNTDEILNIELVIELKNTGGICYTQSFQIELKRLPVDNPISFMVRCFNTAINFNEDKK